MRIYNKTVYFFANTLRKFGFDFNEQSDPKVLAMKKEIANLGGKIEFKIEQFSDGSWVAESTNVDGIITGSKKLEDIPGLIKDAIFTFFEIPPHLCNDNLLLKDNEPATVMHRVYV